MGGLDWDGAVKDIKGSVLYLKSIGCKKVGVLGFCMGGALTIAAMCYVPEIDAGTPFYGIPDLSKATPSNIKNPIVAYFGENDEAKGFSDAESARKLEKTLKDAGVNFTLKMMPGCGHAFMN
eukprot:TRINITY_DN65068_c0_g1_i3.p1 TRINITY_DN65068_c0_g1~~TRINITY_DN65068_c0_g1_i3.p1  ORF type:complete len:122 (-),score=0.48 TRINITY_DN65068_c0_g1_i3:182-547(-)